MSQEGSGRLIQFLDHLNKHQQKPKDTPYKEYRCGKLKLQAKQQTVDGKKGWFWVLIYRFRLKDLSAELNTYYVGNKLLSFEQVEQIIENVCNSLIIRKSGSFANPLKRKTWVEAGDETISVALERSKTIIDKWLQQELNVFSILVEKPTAKNKKRGSPTVEDFWPIYCKYARVHSAGGKGWKDITYTKKQSKFKNWIKPWFGKKKLIDIKKVDIENWIQEMREKKNLTQNTLLYNYRMLKNIFDFATELDTEDRIERKPQRRLNGLNPFDRIKNPPQQKKPDPYRKTYTPADLLTIIEYAEIHDTTLVPLLTMSIETGLRIGEMRGLRWEHCNWQTKKQEDGTWSYGVIEVVQAIHSHTNVPTIPKVGITRQVGISEELRTLLTNWARLSPKIGETPCIQHTHISPNGSKSKSWKQWGERGGRVDMHTDPSGFIFCAPNGEPFLYSSWLDRLNIVLQACELKIKGKAWHEFRHGFISHAVNKGLDIKWIQRTVGHVDLKTTLGYMQNVKYDPSRINMVMGDLTQLRKKKRNERAQKRRAAQRAKDPNYIPPPPPQSKFTGVAKIKGRKKKPWVVHLKHNGKQLYLGTFPTQEQAAEAWDVAALKKIGKEAKLNFPDKIKTYRKRIKKGEK